MSAEPLVTIGPFAPQDQDAVRQLILSGLGEHWGTIDPTLNPDLNDIASSYAQGVFLVARLDGRIVGTGALLPRSTETAEVVRMSVDRALRRGGIGTLILEHLCARARQNGFRRIVLETTATWDEVIAFYLRFGFRITHEREGPFGRDLYFALDL